MAKLSAPNKQVKRTVKIGNVTSDVGEAVEDVDARIEAIQLLIPLGLQAVTEELHRSVVELAGPRYERKDADQGSRTSSLYSRCAGCHQLR